MVQECVLIDRQRKGSIKQWKSTGKSEGTKGAVQIPKAQATGKTLKTGISEGVDREKSVTITKIAVLLEVGAAMTAEIAGACVFTSILDLISASA